MGNKDKSKISSKRGKKDVEIKYSLSLKLTLIVALLSFIIIFALSLTNIYMQSESDDQLLDLTSKKSVVDFAESHSVIKSIDEYFVSFEIFNDSEEVQNYILDLTESTNGTDVLKISIIKEVGEELFIFASTDVDSIGEAPHDYSYNSSKSGDTFYIIEEDEPILTIVSAFNISGEVVGTYEIVLLMSPPVISHEEQIKLVILISFISILILIFSLLYLLRRIIVKPITMFRDKTQIIGKGNLDTKVDIDSKDELGDLAYSFNQMAKDLKQSRDKIEDYTQILESLLDQKDEFIGQLGHDLKNPLQPLIGLLPMLIEREKDPKIKEGLEVMYTNAEYMRDLIFKTLELAKLRSSTIEFEMENLNLADEVQDVITSQKILLDENKIIIKNKVKKDIIVSADKLRLAEVFKNLIANSIKYTEGGGEITIDAKQKKDTVTVSLQDSGIGMTKEQIKHVFDEFYRADKSTRITDSVGLGLSICKRIVEKHGGKIWVDSAGPGKGTTFYFTLKTETKNN